MGFSDGGFVDAAARRRLNYVPAACLSRRHSNGKEAPGMSEADASSRVKESDQWQEPEEPPSLFSRPVASVGPA